MLRWLGRAPRSSSPARSSTSATPRCRRPAPGGCAGTCGSCTPRSTSGAGERGLTWASLARELDCTPSRLTNLRTARLADMDLTMRVTQWLGRPAAEFIHPADW